jgi:hypothetical protein
MHPLRMGRHHLLSDEREMVRQMQARIGNSFIEICAKTLTMDLEQKDK